MMNALDQKNDEVNKAEALVERAKAAYLGLAVGDALGASVEFMTPREIAVHHGVHDEIIGQGWLNLAPGSVTDDTEMSLALGQAIIDCQGHITAKAISESFSQWMSRKPVDIGNTVRRGIIQYRKKGQTAVPENPFDAGNGAAMRCLPIALFGLGLHAFDLRALSDLQAHTTHNCALSDCGTFTVVQMVQSALLYPGDRDRLYELVHGLVGEHGVYSFSGRRMENPSGYIVDSLKAVFQSFFETDSFEDCLVNVVNRGGDADTTGAIAGMIAGAFYGLEALPDKWLDQLDRTIHAYCERQASSLVGLSPIMQR